MHKSTPGPYYRLVCFPTLALPRVSAEILSMQEENGEEKTEGVSLILSPLSKLQASP